MIEKNLQQAFEETHFIVHHKPPFTLRIGQPSFELDALLQSTGHGCAAFITAWNPMCQVLESAENNLRQKKLTEELEGVGLIILPGIGQHPSNGWLGEESILILGLQLETAKKLACRYKQIAFVWHSISDATKLVHTQS